jgi:hypothetical protein
MKKLNLQNVWHLESDNMVYADFTHYTETASRLFTEVAANPLGSHSAVGYSMTGGLMFLKDYLAAEALSLFSWKQIMKRNNNGFSDPQNNDMVDLGTIQQNLGVNFLDNLPILPYGKFSRYAKSFNMSLFDAAGYGQFLDGVGRASMVTSHSKKGWAGAHHFIGDAFLNSMIQLSWKQDEKARWFPVVQDTKSKQMYRLNNLHVYSKHLSEFRSDQSRMPEVPPQPLEHAKGGTVREWHIHGRWEER